MRDSGLNISYALRSGAIEQKRASYQNATSNNFDVGSYDQMIPTADLVINLTPDKNHTSVVEAVMPLMKKGATFSYSHGFNIVEEGTKFRDDLTVIMVAPKSPGSEVREEYLRGFGVPTLIAVHSDNDPQGKGWEQAKAYCVGTGGDRAGVAHGDVAAGCRTHISGFGHADSTEFSPAPDRRVMASDTEPSAAMWETTALLVGQEERPRSVQTPAPESAARSPWILVVARVPVQV